MARAAFLDEEGLAGDRGGGVANEGIALSAGGLSLRG